MTYSIVARDPETGALGVAVQSHWFSVGSVVPWARPGVGAVATQAFARADYGPRALELIAGGRSASAALAELLAADPGRDVRQVAVLDAAGGVAAHTGPDCIRSAGDVQDAGVSCQANIMVDDRVWPAMLDGYRAAAARSDPFAERLLAALVAAQAAGGDLRGVQSAALLVVPAAGEPWETEVSLRVEDGPDPLGELARLLALRRAYDAAGAGDERLAAGDRTGAADAFARATELAPEARELRFWAALGSGDEAALRELGDAHPEWSELRSRLPAERRPEPGR